MKRLCLFSLLLSHLYGQFALAPVAKQQFFNNTGAPLSGGCIFTYAAGTTTLQATYTDATGATPNANPIALDSTGRPPFNIFLGTQSYKFTVTNAPSSGSCSTINSGATLYTVDNVSVPGLLVNNVTITAGNSLTLQPGSATSIATALLPQANATYNIGAIGNAFNFGYFTTTVTNQAFTNSFQSFIGPNNFAGTSTFTGPVTISGNVLAGLTSTDLSVLTGTVISQGGFDAVTAPSNASIMGMGVVAGNYGYLSSGHSTSGSLLPMAFFTNNAERMRIDLNGNVLVGLTSTDLSVGGYIISGGSGILMASAPSNASLVGMSMVPGVLASVTSNRSGTGTFLPLDFDTGGAHQMVLDTAGNLTVNNGNVTIPAQKSTTGQRYVCITTTGQLVSSASACSGT